MHACRHSPHQRGDHGAGGRAADDLGQAASIEQRLARGNTHTTQGKATHNTTQGSTVRRISGGGCGCSTLITPATRPGVSGGGGGGCTESSSSTRLPPFLLLLLLNHEEAQDPPCWGWGAGGAGGGLGVVGL